MEDLSEEELRDSFYPQIARSVPKCLPEPPMNFSRRSVTNAVRFLESRVGTLRGSVVRRLVTDVLEMYGESRGHEHRWPSQLAGKNAGLGEYLSDAETIGSVGCAITWYEDDVIGAASMTRCDIWARTLRCNPACCCGSGSHNRRISWTVEVKLVFDHVRAMLRSLRIGARIVNLIREVDDEHLREHRKKSGLSNSAGPCWCTGRVITTVSRIGIHSSPSTKSCTRVTTRAWPQGNWSLRTCCFRSWRAWEVRCRLKFCPNASWSGRRIRSSGGCRPLAQFFSSATGEAMRP